MSNYRLSIIIPVYNVEAYLEECLDSVLRQKSESCQIILVDDGSTDSSGNICDRYKALPGFTVIHKENGGSSSARNIGLRAANGEYIAFLDSDDRLAPESIKKCIEWAAVGEADICFLDAIVFYPDGKVYPLGDCIKPSKVRGRTKEEVFDHLSTRPKYPGSACTAIFKNSFLKEKGIVFPEEKKYCEDLFFCFDCYIAAEKFDAQSFPYYEYRKSRIGSKTTDANTKNFWAMSAFVKYVANQCAKGKTPKGAIEEFALSFAAYEYSIMLWQYSWFGGDERKKALEALKQYRWLLHYGRSGKLRLVKTVVGLFGFEVAAKILDVYMRHR